MLMDLLFPPRCPGCGAAGRRLCDRCTATLRTAPAIRAIDSIDSVAAAVVYGAVAGSVVKAAKFSRHRDALAPAGRLVASIAPSSCDLVTWVPTTSARRRERGADIARELARCVAGELTLECRATMQRLDRARQTNATRRDRLAGPSFEGFPTVAGARILLVDDVVTTGATLRSAGRALVDAGAAAVHARTFAATIYDRSPQALAGADHRAGRSHGRTDQLPAPRPLRGVRCADP